MVGMVKHILLAKFKPDVSPEQQRALIEGYASLLSSIDAMKSFEWGTDVSVENFHEGYTHVFQSTFDSSEGRDEYLVHPVHQAYANELLPALEKVCVVDYSPTVIVKASA